ncbi:hypothetical protein [Oceanithermus sp.]
MQKKFFWLLVVMLIATAWGAGNSASTRFVVSVPEVLVLKVNGVAGGKVPVRIEGGQVEPGILHVEVLANTGWRLTVRTTPLEGPVTLPAERLSLAGQRLSRLEQTVRIGRGAASIYLPLSVELLPGEPDGEYRSLLTFELYKL